MSVHAGSIVTVAGQCLIDRIQTQGLGQVKVPIETIREVGNELVVDKIPGEAEFTFTLESLDVTTELEAILHGNKAAGAASGQALGIPEPDGTSYKWSDCRAINILSPWKDPNTGSAGTVNAGHLVPNYYPSRIRYQFGVTANATQQAELKGGSFYYGKAAPFEDFFAGDGSTAAFASTHPAIRYRRGGSDGSTFRSIFGVLVDGTPQVDGTDYNVSGGASNPGSTATVTFTAGNIPANGSQVRFCYFSSAAQSWPQSVHASTIVKPGAIRGRNINVAIKARDDDPGSPIAGSGWIHFPSVQTAELEATVDSQIEREFGNEDPVGQSVLGTDVNGQVVVRYKNAFAFLNSLRQLTSVDTSAEVLGYLNLHAVQLKIELQNPKNPGQILKTLYCEDAIFDIPGTPAKVNTPTDFTLSWAARTGDYTAIKGALA